jgi:hypothetical protein
MRTALSRNRVQWKRMSRRLAENDASRRLDFLRLWQSRKGSPGPIRAASFLPCNTQVACYIEQLVAGARPASVAQLVEPRFCKPVVVGSSPSASFGMNQAIFAPAGPHLAIVFVIVQGGATHRTSIGSLEVGHSAFEHRPRGDGRRRWGNSRAVKGARL